MTKKQRIKHIEAQLVAYHNTMSILEKKVEALEAWKKGQESEPEIRVRFIDECLDEPEPEPLRCPWCNYLLHWRNNVGPGGCYVCSSQVCYWHSEAFSSANDSSESELRKRLGGV